MFKEKYTITLIIFIIEYFIAFPFALKYANGITTKASKTNIHKTRVKYWVSIPVNSDISNLKIDARAKNRNDVKIIDIDEVLNTSSLLESLLKNLKKLVSKP